jgi:hypothetical protein
VILLADAGHLLVDLPLYGGPVVLLAAALAISTARSRRRDDQLR